MATIKQIDAYRRNSKKSTGPRTLAGKAVSEMNARITGIDAASLVIPGEDAAALQSLAADYFHHHRPDTPEQRALVVTLIGHDWLLRRLRKTESQIWQMQAQNGETGDPLSEKFPLGDTFISNATIFSHLQRRIDSTGRAFHRALKELQRLETARPNPDPPPSSALLIIETEPPSSPIELASSRHPCPGPAFPPTPA